MIRVRLSARSASMTVVVFSRLAPLPGLSAGPRCIWERLLESGWAQNLEVGSRADGDYDYR
jgi:hypothetical protein